MSECRPFEKSELGADLRALRKTRGLTLIALAKTLQKSVGWMSQVERGLSVPTPEDLQKICAALDVSVASLVRRATFAAEEGLIVRQDARRPIGSRAAGLFETLLSPDLTDDFEVIHSRFIPGACLNENISRDTQEIGYIVSGQFDLWIDEHQFKLSAGDSFRLRGEAYRWANHYDQPCEIIWVISPPVY